MEQLVTRLDERRAERLDRDLGSESVMSSSGSIDTHQCFATTSAVALRLEEKYKNNQLKRVTLEKERIK